VVVHPTSRDPDDDHVLAAAVAAHADAIVSGDKDLLVLGTFQGILILSPTEFIQRFFTDFDPNI
jgi:predicted nucleic acid-binding protein